MKIILVDGNAVGYHASSTRKLSTEDGRPTQAIFHSIKSIWALTRRYPEHRVLILWDSHCQWRYDLLPEYKGKRETNPKQIAQREEYRAQRDAIKEAFRLMGLTQVAHEGYEADDIAGVYARKVAALPDAEAILYTGDKDWIQLVAENVLWHNIDDDKIIGVKNFQRETGFPDVSSFIQAKALHGDGSDNISGVGRIGDKTAQAIINHFGSVKRMLSKYSDTENGFVKGDFAGLEEEATLNRALKPINRFCSNEEGGLDTYKRNLKLMNLHTIKPPKGGHFFRQKLKPHLEGFKSFCLEYELTTIYGKAEKIFNDLEKQHG